MIKDFIKINLKVIVSVLISGIIFTGIGVFAGVNSSANQITFNPSDINKEKGFTANNVEDALNQLYENADNITLVGEKNINFNSSLTTLTYADLNLQNEGFMHKVENGYEIDQSGKYLVILSVGSNNNSTISPSYSGFLYMDLNDSNLFYLQQSYDRYDINPNIVELKKGDTIAFKYKGDGGKYTKNIRIYIYKV